MYIFEYILIVIAMLITIGIAFYLFGKGLVLIEGSQNLYKKHLGDKLV